MPLGTLSEILGRGLPPDLVTSIMVVLLVALSLEASSTDAPSCAESAAAGAALLSSPEVGPPKVAVETPSDEEFAMASKGVP